MSDSKSNIVWLTCGWCHGDPYQMIGVDGTDDPCQKCDGKGRVPVLRKAVEEYQEDGPNESSELDTVGGYSGHG